MDIPMNPIISGMPPQIWAAQGTTQGSACAGRHNVRLVHFPGVSHLGTFHPHHSTADRHFASKPGSMASIPVIIAIFFRMVIALQPPGHQM